MNKKMLKETALGGVFNNPVFVLVLGMCPTIAMSTSIVSAFGLGVATAFVLIFSNLFISLLRKVIPDQVRLPVYIIIIATFVTLVELTMANVTALAALNKAIGAFIPLIVVNCIILGRAEAFAGKNKVGYAVLDGVSMGIGFILSISLLGGIRQLLRLMGLQIFGTTPGGFIILGLIMALFNHVLAMYKQFHKKELLKELA